MDDQKNIEQNTGGNPKKNNSGSNYYRNFRYKPKKNIIKIIETIVPNEAPQIDSSNTEQTIQEINTGNEPKIITTEAKHNPKKKKRPNNRLPEESDFKPVLILKNQLVEEAIIKPEIILKIEDSVKIEKIENSENSEIVVPLKSKKKKHPKHKLPEVSDFKPILILKNQLVEEVINKPEIITDIEDSNKPEKIENIENIEIVVPLKSKKKKHPKHKLPEVSEIKPELNSKNLQDEEVINPELTPISDIPLIETTKINVPVPQEKRPSKKKPIHKIPEIIINKKKLISNNEKSDPRINKIISKLDNLLKHQFYIEENSAVLICVSGGVDSIVMADALFQVLSKINTRIVIAHFNHKLRGEDSDKDQEFVKKFAYDYGVQFFTSGSEVKVFARRRTMSIEQAARTLRYTFFEKAAKTTKCGYISTAHTSDDSAETLLFNLFRGTGLTGLRGIPQFRAMTKNLSIIRPFLDFTKQDIIEYAEARNLKWREDKSNTSLLFTRNKIRHKLIPMLREDFSPTITENLNRASRLIAGADEFISNYIKSYSNNIIKDKNLNRIYFKLSFISTLSPFIQGELLEYYISNFFNTEFLPIQTIERLLSLENSEVGSICEINKNLIAVRDRNEIIVTIRKIPQENYVIPIDIPGEARIGRLLIILKEVPKEEVKYNTDPNIEFLDMDNLPKSLSIRNKRDGDTFQPLGMTDYVKISDFLINQKIPIIDKDNYPLLSTPGNILWICGLRISESCKIQKTTKRFLRAEIQTIK